jgi:hypothetical protein
MLVNVRTWRLCFYIQSHMKLVILKKIWMKTQTNMDTEKGGKINDTDDEEIKNTSTCPTQEAVALRTKQLL